MDLIAVVADWDYKQALEAFLGRKALGIRPIAAEVRVHPAHDPGCLRHSHEFLRPFLNRFPHALVMFDRDRPDLRSWLQAQGVWAAQWFALPAPVEA